MSVKKMNIKKMTEKDIKDRNAMPIPQKYPPMSGAQIQTALYGKKGLIKV